MAAIFSDSLGVDGAIGGEGHRAVNPATFLTRSFLHQRSCGSCAPCAPPGPSRPAISLLVCPSATSRITCISRGESDSRGTSSQLGFEIASPDAAE